MSNRRFMINSRSIQEDHAWLEGSLFTHMVRVLRLGRGASLTLVDEQGVEHRGSIQRVEKERVLVGITASLTPGDGEGEGPSITICQALPKGEKTDLILQKGTELGVHDFRLFAGCRSVPRIRREQLAAKLERWNRIGAEAARQCNRRVAPEVSWFPDAEQAAGGCHHGLRLLLWEGEQRQGLKSALERFPSPASIVVAIGPEGGFDPGEVSCFSEHGFVPVTLGTRILRTETASLAITAILQYIWGKM
jgi:16S rRNA (uracil1498-N3)-methyltransferase